MDVVVVVDKEKREIIKDITKIQVVPDITIPSVQTVENDPIFPKLLIYKNKNVIAIFNEWKYYVITKP